MRRGRPPRPGEDCRRTAPAASARFEIPTGDGQGRRSDGTPPLVVLGPRKEGRRSPVFRRSAGHRRRRRKESVPERRRGTNRGSSFLSSFLQSTQMGEGPSRLRGDVIEYPRERRAPYPWMLDSRGVPGARVRLFDHAIAAVGRERPSVEPAGDGGDQSACAFSGSSS